MNENLTQGVRALLVTLAPYLTNLPARRAAEKAAEVLGRVADETTEPEDAADLIAALAKVLQ